MKTCVALVCAILAVLACTTEAVISDRLRMFVRPRMIECANQLGLPAGELQALIDNDLRVRTDGMEKTCLCFYQAIRMIDAQGNLLPISTAFRFSLGDSPVRAVRAARVCSRERGTSPQNQAWLINKCFVDQGLL